MALADPATSRVVRCPPLEDTELERVHAAAAAGQYRHFAGEEAPRDRHPPLTGTDYVPLRWPGHAHLDQPDRRDPRRQIPHARRAIERAKAKAGFLADLQS